MKNKVLAWLLFLPAAVLATIIVLILWHYFNILSFKFTGFDSTGWTAQLIDSVSKGVIGGAVFVFIGTSIVPKYQKQVALILVGLITLYALLGYVSDFSILPTEKKVFRFINIISVLAGSYRTFFYFNENDNSPFNI